MSDPREKAPAEMSDRELDAAVAQEAMGLHVVPSKTRCLVETGLDAPSSRFFEPSTDPAAMMEVKRHLAKNYGMALTVVTDQTGCICTIRRGTATHSSGLRHPDAEPRAVAIAALLAVREGEK